MKRVILITLCAAMMFMGAAPAEAKAACAKHDFEKTGEYWVPTGNGYNHTYTGSDGETHGCAVTIMRRVDVEVCQTCGTVNHVNTDKTYDRHSTNHA